LLKTNTGNPLCDPISLQLLFNGVPFTKSKNMANEKKVEKKEKKKPEKNLKEKRAEKKAKKESKNRA